MTRPSLFTAMRAGGEARRQRAAERQARARERFRPDYTDLDRLAEQELQHPGSAGQLPAHIRAAVLTRVETLRARRAARTEGSHTP